MSNIKEQIKSVFNKYGIDPSSVGIKFEEETAAAEAPATELKFAVEGTLADGTKIYSTANEWVVTTGTRTQVAWIFRVGFPKIFRDSFRTLISSLV